ncbi:putative subunit 5 of TFIIH basal transcription factor complex TTD-A [Chloropicon primus]|uniref:General transcription and DNA repair factor IIH subunit TFB5 n=1 Tax=Chloropicon primus TaxID=1764295 RepID=A0A5B8MG37_9CHLO|nr:putative subunit 5 of TFIIH basal transcription factor complex TTD-A [Chloropicon primus]UPQ98372.1 putative subunit 5 of TFIIH basal transcription factor complex TTD-A [Chloropicon primus]|eukprot:QDZ19164.1 putative subunit 5 of TFIIH basal transcription factor complex TTD-A [Chloropicon primus]
MGSEPIWMVQAMKGVLLKGDIPLKQFVISLNEARIPSERFIIADLDERTLLIQPQAEAFLQEKLQVFVDENQYQPPLRSSGHSSGRK